MLGVIAVVCLLSNWLSWWLYQMPQVVQPAWSPFAIDFHLVGYAVYGVLFIQPAILSVYLAYGWHRVITRLVLSGVAFTILWAAHLVGWGSAHVSGPMFLHHQEFIDLTVLFGAQVTSLSFAMWVSRIMRGWRLSRNEDSVGGSVPALTRRERVTETIMLFLVSYAGSLGAGWLLSEPDVGVLYFSVFALLGTLVIAPIAFASLRFQNFVVILSALLLLVIAIPSALFGFLSWIESLQPGTSTLQYFGPLLGAFFAAAMLAATLFAVRTAGFRLEQPVPEKKTVAKVPIDPLAD